MRAKIAMIGLPGTICCVSTEKIKAYMRSDLHIYPDLYLDGIEVNMTLLAENTAAEFGLYEKDSYTIPESVFEAAYLISSQFEEV